MSSRGGKSRFPATRFTEWVANVAVAAAVFEGVRFNETTQLVLIFFHVQHLALVRKRKSTLQTDKIITKKSQLTFNEEASCALLEVGQTPLDHDWALKI